MSGEIDYNAVRDDLKGRIEQFQAALAAVENILATGSPSSGSTQQQASGAREDFLGMTIPDAAKTFLEAARSAQTIGQIHEGIKRGGMGHTKYNAVYTAIWRREHPAGFFARQPGSDTLWGLAEWWPTSLAGKKKANKEVSKQGAKKPVAKKAKGKKAKGKRSSVSIIGATEQLLRDEGKPLHASVLIERLAARFNKTTTIKNLISSIRRESKQRFENLGGNMWALAEWPLAQKQIPQS